MPQTFDPAIVASARDSKEVRIRTARQKGRGVIIWIVAVGDALYVRSVRGPAGKWFVAASADGQAILDLGHRQFPVSVVPVTDQVTIDKVSQAFLSKYAMSPYAPSIVRAETLPTTLRLDPM
jgi:hypothetical protein